MSCANACKIVRAARHAGTARPPRPREVDTAQTRPRSGGATWSDVQAEGIKRGRIGHLQPGVDQASIWRCRILESSGLWTTVMTRAEWGRAVRPCSPAPDPTRAQAITRVRRVRRSRHTAGVEEQPRRRGQRATSYSAVLLHQDHQVGARPAVVRSSARGTGDAGVRELCHPRVVVDHVRAERGQGAGPAGPPATRAGRRCRACRSRRAAAPSSRASPCRRR